MIYTLSMLNTGQITLPKKWRDKQGTTKFVAEETDDGLLIRPAKRKKDEIVYYENEDSIGIYCESGLDIAKMIAAIDKINQEEKYGKVSKNNSESAGKSKKSSD